MATQCGARASSHAYANICYLLTNSVSGKWLLSLQCPPILYSWIINVTVSIEAAGERWDSIAFSLLKDAIW